MVFRNYIAGEWVDSTSAMVNRNPSDLSDVIGEYAEADANQVQQAVAAARRTFAEWSRRSALERSEVLRFVARELEERKEELGELLSREEGKVLKDGINEVARSAKVFEYFAAQAIMPIGERLPSLRPNIEVEAVREPLGVIAILTPWNLPIGIPTWKIAPALAYGNCVVFKPASLVPGCAWALTEIISRSGLPAGVFNLVMGGGSAVGEMLISSEEIDGITFTGSVATGGHIAKVAGAHQVKLQMEMGGKNPLVVLGDADLDVAIDCAVNGAYLATGQRCTASSRLIVAEEIHDRFISGVVERMKALRVGHALSPDTDIGPVVDQRQLRTDLEYISLGAKEGAELVCGGEQLNRETEGYYLAPALFADSTNQMRINLEEIFGPVAAVIRVKDYEEALEVANDTPFGLASGICTRSMGHANHFKRHAMSGIVMINLPTAGADFHAPFGGRKRSNYGSRELSTHAREFYTAVRTVYVATGY